ncbi:MAG TPA: hypothetical protein VEV84_16415 [Pyrinomonadaceae bacterium]|nr:hypothetical protein [Pyrinomonadaceae bacterium]
MYCPRCSKEFAKGTSYCRTCGLSLDGVVEIVTGDAENEPEIRSGPNGKLMRAGIGSFILGSVIGLSTPVFKNLELFGAAGIASYIFLGSIMLGIILLGIGFVFPQKRYIRKKGEALSGTEDYEGLATGRLTSLPSADRNVDDILFPTKSREPDSVTEDTTRQLR